MPEIPCACGSRNAYWHGDIRREYCCDECWYNTAANERAVEEEEECMVDNCFEQSTHSLQWGILRMRYCSEHYAIKKESRDSGMNDASTTARR